jgi:hypothetical protein
MLRNYLVILIIFAIAKCLECQAGVHNDVERILKEMSNKELLPDDISINYLINSYVNSNDILGAKDKYLFYLDEIYDKKTLSSDILDLHSNHVYVQKFDTKTDRIRSVSSVIADLILQIRLDRNNFPSEIIVGQHGKDKLKDAVINFLDQRKYSYTIPSTNPGIITNIRKKAFQFNLNVKPFSPKDK